MKPQDVIQEVERIRAMGDNEPEAHIREDDLWRAVLTAIAGGARQPHRLAEEALKTQDIDFCRWYE